MLEDLLWLRHELSCYVTWVSWTGHGNLSRVVMNPTLEMAIRFMGYTFCQLTLYSVPLATHRLPEILSFQTNSRQGQLLAYSSVGKVMTISVQLQTTFMNLQRVLFVSHQQQFHQLLSIPVHTWRAVSGFSRDNVYSFYMVPTPSTTYKTNSTVKFWIWVSVSCSWLHP